MSKAKAVGAVLLAAAALIIVMRATETSRKLDSLWQAESLRQQLAELAYERVKAELNAELQALEATTLAVRTEGDRQRRKAKAEENAAAEKRTEAQRTLEKYKAEHWVRRWVPNSVVGKTIVRMEESIENLSCRERRAGLVFNAAGAYAKREVAHLQERKEKVERTLASLKPEPSNRSMPGWIDIFFGRWSPPTVLQPFAGLPATPAPRLMPRLFTYGLPTISLPPAPVHKTTLLDLLDVRSASELSKWLTSFGKDVQDEAIRIWKDKEDGMLVDIAIGCEKVTLNRPVAEALWAKYHYFLAQTDYQCEIRPSSDFRDFIKQHALGKDAGKAGPPVAKPLDSKHVIGDAVDQSVRCQANRVPFDFDPEGRVTFISFDKQGRVVHETGVREAIVSRRRAEFADDYKRLLEAAGDVKAWEESQYKAALYELLHFPPGTGIYGAHAMSFEAGLKAGLVSAFCGIPHDPIHSEKSINGSTAECSGKLKGAPACYRVDRNGNPDCWRGSTLWEARIEASRKRHWGAARFAALYGPNRLDPYLPRVGAGPAK